MTKLEQLKETLRTTAVRVENQEQAEVAAKIFEACGYKISFPINFGLRYPTHIAHDFLTKTVYPFRSIPESHKEISPNDLESLYKDAVGESDKEPSWMKTPTGIETKIDWEQVRIDAAIAAMQGFYSGVTNPNCRDEDLKQDAILFVRAADALVNELRKGGSDL